METRTKNIDNRTYTFVNEFINRRDGFNHKTTLLCNGVELVTNNVHYINRTWECYTYETSMRGAVNTLIDSKLNRHIARYKEENGIIRFKKGEKDRVIADFKASDIYKELQALKDAIQSREFD